MRHLALQMASALEASSQDLLTLEHCSTCLLQNRTQVSILVLQLWSQLQGPGMYLNLKSGSPVQVLKHSCQHGVW